MAPETRNDGPPAGHRPAGLPLGYICSWHSSKKTAVGGAAYLSVDEDGRPIEFLTTAPVDPDSLTRALYGSSLVRVVLEKAVGSLLKEVRQRPVCVFVDEPDLFRLNPSAESGVQLVLLQAAEPASSEKGGGQEIEAGGRRYRVTAAEQQAYEVAKGLLEKLAWDPLEPFERLRKAKAELAS
ncbi:hypothetical protein [Thermopirellula anaerolimosa]